MRNLYSDIAGCVVEYEEVECLFRGERKDDIITAFVFIILKKSEEVHCNFSESRPLLLIGCVTQTIFYSKK